MTGSLGSGRSAGLPVMVYEMWMHEMLGIFSIRLEDGEVCGVHGPIPLPTAVDCDPTSFDCDPTSFDYDEREAAIARARDTPEQFMLLEQWLQGGVEYRPLPFELDVVWSFLAVGCSLLRRWLRLGHRR